MPRASASPPRSPEPGQLAEFEIQRRLGAGGMAEVFLAKKRGAQGTYKLLVVKRILPTHGTSRRFHTMFVEEALLATRLNHPNVVQVYEFYDSGTEGQLLAMEYVEGCDLGRLMSAARHRGERIPPWLGAWIVSEAAKGLHYAHEKRDERGQRLEIVHRDVSPQNVLLSYEGAVKIADFGIASAKNLVEETGVIKGKFGYMSPEQARGEKVDKRSDLYALGVILWEILAGRAIHGALGGEALLDIVRSGVVEAPGTVAEDVPAELETIAMKALSPHRADRPESGRELAQAIGRALLGRRQLVDASTLEGYLTLVGMRERTQAQETEKEAEPSSRASEARTQAAVPLARSTEGGPSSMRLPAAADAGFASQSLPAAPARPREVRHVAILSAVFEGTQALAAQDRALAFRTIDRLRTMLGDLAFKQNARFAWSGDVDSGLTGTAILGLAAKPSRAAEEAAWLALDTHETLGGFNVDLPSPVGARIGVARGIASGTRDPDGHLDQFELEEPAAYLASLLARTTPVGATWVTGGAYRLVRRDFRWGDAPALQIPKDAPAELPEHMRIYGLERSLSREERAAELGGMGGDLVGRDAERAELHAAYHQAVSGAGGVGELASRAIVGEMGIGKSALVAAFVGELPPNARIIRVECAAVRMEVPFSALADLVRDAVGTTGDEPFDQVCELIARAGGGSAYGDGTSPMVARLAELATNRQMGGEDEDAVARRKILLSGIRSLLAAIALSQPLVVVLEGVQWADRASLDIVAEVLSLRDPLPILFLVIARPDDRLASLLNGLLRVELAGLTTEEQVRLVEARLGVREGTREVLGELVPRVAGNPFFLLEMVDALLERGSLEIRELARDDDPAPISVLTRTERADAEFSQLPSTLEQLVGDRIRELPPEERAVAEWLAIAAVPLAPGDIAKLSQPREASEVEAAVVRLCARGLCDKKGELVDFRHPLTRDVAYLEIAPPQRAEMHRALGDHLAQTSLARGVSAAIVARHFSRGDAPSRAADFYLEAAGAARTSYQTQLAIRYYQRALGLVPEDDKRRLSAHEALEAIYRVLGRRRDRVLHLEALRRISKVAATPRAVCLALVRTARFDYDEGRLARGVSLAEKAAGIAHDAKLSPLEVEACGLVSECMRELGDVQGALAACDRALASCNPVTNPGVPPRAHAEVLRSRGVLLRRVGRVREAVDAYVDAVAVARRTGARRLEARVKNALAFAMFVQGRYEDAVALGLESIQIDLSIGGRFQIAKTLTNIGHAYFRLGDIARAEAYLKRSRDAHERYGDHDARADTLLVCAGVKLELGELDAAEGFLNDATALVETNENAYDRCYALVTKAALAHARRDARAAVEQAMEGRRAAEAQALVSFHFYGLAIEAAARVDLGEMHAATLLATTALGAVETLQGCEYGLEIRAISADVLKRAGSPQAVDARQRAVDYAVALMNTIRDPRLKSLFPQRPMVTQLLDATPVPPSSPREQGSSSPPTP